MKGDGNYREQADRQLEKAVYKGELTIADFYSHKLDVQQASLSGVEDGHSCTKCMHTYTSNHQTQTNLYLLVIIIHNVTCILGLHVRRKHILPILN